MLPKEKDFWENISKYGISSWKDQIVLYDSSNYYVASARVYWMLQVFGFQNVKVLMGGFEEWRRLGFPLEVEKKSGISPDILSKRVEQSGVYREEKVVGFQKMKEISRHACDEQSKLKKRNIILDARSSERFFGLQAEPRPGLRCGHIPGSLNIPYTLLFPSEGGHFHSQEKTKEMFENLGVSFVPESEPTFITTTCGSGVTAAVVALALEWCGYPGTVAVYDGSFTEWGDPHSGATVVSNRQ
jgi:thiosulfate/3-mercaptopyruvate sulfurtransferase